MRIKILILGFAGLTNNNDNNKGITEIRGALNAKNKCKSVEKVQQGNGYQWQGCSAKLRKDS